MYKAKSIRPSPLQPQPTWDYWKRRREINAKAIQIASTRRDYDKHLERAGVKHFSFLCDSFCRRCNNADHLFYWIDCQLICPQCALVDMKKEERRGQRKQKATAKGKQYEVESAKKLAAKRKNTKSMPKESAPSMGANNNATSTVEAKKRESLLMAEDKNNNKIDNEKSNKDNDNAFDSPAGDDGNLSDVASILGGKDHGDHDKIDDCTRNDDSGKPSEQDKHTESTPKNDSTKNLLKRKDHIQHTTTKLEGEKFGRLSIQDLFDGSFPVEEILSIDNNLKHNALKVWRQVKSNPIEKISLSLCDILMARDDYNALGNEIDRILNINANIGGNLFDFDVIDGRVYSGNHFSQLFIFNAKSLKGYNKSKFMENDDSDHPFILYANSLPDCGWHLTDKVAEKLCKFLNKYGLEHNVFKVRAYSKNTIPAIKIDVPVQLDTWTCGYQCLVTRYHVMKKLQDGQKILLKDVESGEVNFCDGRKDSDSLLSTMVQNDIPSPFEIIVINDSDGKAEKEPPRPIRRPEHTKKKRKSDQSAGNTAAQRRGMAKKKEQKRSKNRRFVTRIMHARDWRSSIEKWWMGEPAMSLEAYDDAYCAALYHFSSCTEIYQTMCDYQSEHANRKLPKASSIAIIKNCPQCLIITCKQDRSKVKELVDDLYNHFENYKFVSDPNTIDVEIMGEDQPKTVLEFIQKRRCSKPTKADLEDNNEALKQLLQHCKLTYNVKHTRIEYEIFNVFKVIKTSWDQLAQWNSICPLSPLKDSIPTWKGSQNVLPLNLTVDDSPTCAQRLQRSLPHLEVLLLIPTGELEVTKGPTNPFSLVLNTAPIMWWNYVVPVKKTASMYKMGPPQGKYEPPKKDTDSACAYLPYPNSHQRRLNHGRLLKEDYYVPTTSPFCNKESKWMVQRSSFPPPQSKWMLQPCEEQKNYHRWLRDPFPQKFQEHTTVQASPFRELDRNYHGDRIFPHPITPVQMDVATSHST
eukprot:jgi/Psemu1/35006/gm1.35006_g